LNFYFGYDKNVIVECITSLAEASLLDSVADDNYTNLFRYMADKYIYYSITRKGIFLLEKLLSDLDVLYILSLDTYLPDAFLTENIVDSYINGVNTISFYRPNCIKSTISFLAFLLYSDDKERIKFEATYNNNKIDQKEYKGHVDENTFRVIGLLDFKLIGEKIRNYLLEIENSNQRKSERDILEEFLSKV